MTHDYIYHYQQSREQFAEFVINSRNNPHREDWRAWHDMLGTVDFENAEPLFAQAMQSYDEDAEQVKLLWTWENGHVLKIKWEHAGWWKGDVLHHYYCIMLPLRDVEMKFPHQLPANDRHIEDPVWND